MADPCFSFFTNQEIFRREEIFANLQWQRQLDWFFLQLVLQWLLVIDENLISCRTWHDYKTAYMKTFVEQLKMLES